MASSVLVFRPSTDHSSDHYLASTKLKMEYSKRLRDWFHCRDSKVLAAWKSLLYIMSLLAGPLGSSKYIAFTEGQLCRMENHVNSKRDVLWKKRAICSTTAVWKLHLLTEFSCLLHPSYGLQHPQAFSSYSFVTQQRSPSMGLLSCQASVLLSTDHAINSTGDFGFNGEVLRALSWK